MKRRHVSAKWQIYLFMMLFSGILIVLLWIFQVGYLDSFYKMIKHHEAKKVYNQLSSIIKNNDDNLEAKISDIAGKSNYSILLTKPDLSYLYCAEYNPTSSLLNMPTAMFHKFVEAARENGGSYSVTYIGNDNVTMEEEGIPELGGDTINPGYGNDNRFHQNRGQERGESVIYTRLITDNLSEEKVLMVNSTMTPVTATVETLKCQLLLITIALLILATLVGAVVSNIMAKPLISMNEAAKKLAQGDFSQNFTGKQYREIAELSDTLNFAAAELGKSEEYQRELIANVSHDLRTPLTMITGYGEVMRDLPGENTPENVQVIIDEANRLTTLVNDMLDISKLQAGVQQLNETEYNLTQSIRQVFQRYNKLREQEGYVIEFDAKEDVYVVADEEKIFQVVYNLINNAINYTGQDKRVEVKQIVEDDWVRIEIKDSGEGIPQEELGNVWERYYKVDKTHKRGVQGTGLGLSIVKNILKLHEAKFGVESTVGVGSTFWFSMKRVK